MHITTAAAKAMGLSLTPNEHGEKVKADKEYGSSIIRSVIVEVLMLTGEEGLAEYEFASPRKWRFDAAWLPQKVALELNGWTSHHRRERMEADNVKLAAAVRAGWKVYYATAKQAKKEAALWISAALSFPTP